MQMQARQGDIFFEAVKSVPKTTKPKNDPILAYGEVTGHAHKVISPSMDEIDSTVDENGDIYLRSQTKDIQIGHDEHGTITLPAGKNWYKVTRQREYDPISEQRRVVAD